MMVAIRRPHYGHAHRQLRAQWEPIVRAGGIYCARCGDLIDPDEKWHLGHIDGDPDSYQGPEHVKCNCATQPVTRQRRREEVHPGAINA